MNTTNHWLLTHYYWPLSIHQNWFLFRSTKLIDICFRMYFVALLLLLLLLLLHFICASHLIAMPECGMELLRAHRHRRRIDLESTSECIYIFFGLFGTPIAVRLIDSNQLKAIESSKWPIPANAKQAHVFDGSIFGGSTFLIAFLMETFPMTAMNELESNWRRIKEERSSNMKTGWKWPEKHEKKVPIPSILFVYLFCFFIALEFHIDKTEKFVRLLLLLIFRLNLTSQESRTFTEIPKTMESRSLYDIFGRWETAKQLESTISCISCIFSEKKNK